MHLVDRNLALVIGIAGCLPRPFNSSHACQPKATTLGSLCVICDWSETYFRFVVLGKVQAAVSPNLGHCVAAVVASSVSPV